MHLVTLAVTLFLLALAPNLSVLIVTTRAATAGFKQGAAASLGILAATSVYILASIFGLMIVADMRPETRHVLRLLAAVYLVWTGIGRIQNAGKAPLASLPVTHRTAASFAMGFILTLLGFRALLFYVCLIPVFVDIGTLNLPGTGLLLGIAAVAAGLAKLGYVVASARGLVVPTVRVGKMLNVFAGAAVAAAGFALATSRFVHLN